MRIIAIGETTYDIFFRDGKPVSAAVGGSQLNSAVSLGRCGLPVFFVSTIGNDATGNMSIDFLGNNGIDMSFIARFEGNSRIALAFFNEKGDASYSFYAASQQIIPRYPNPNPNDIILFGSSFALREFGRNDLIDFLQLAKNRGAIIVYDPNIRQSLESKTFLKNIVLENIGFSTIVKGSVDDFSHIFNTKNEIQILNEITKVGSTYLACTNGTDGASFFAPGFHFHLPSIPVEIKSTVGAGDNFSAGMIFKLSGLLSNRISINSLSQRDWEDIIITAIKFSSEVCASEENYIANKLLQT